MFTKDLEEIKYNKQIDNTLEEINSRITKTSIYVVAKSCLTLCNPTVHSLPGFPVHGILQARILE